MSIDKNRLKKLAEAATPGPWCWDKGEDPRPHTYGIATDADPECMVVNQDFGIELKEDAYFIAAASPSTVLALLAEIERLEVDNKSLRGSCAAMGKDRLFYVRGQSKAMKERDQLKAENEALRKDAERYRWLRRGENYAHQYLIDLGMENLEGFDRSIDAAMAKEASHG